MNTFPKSEKLCGQLRIAALYREGSRFVSFPMKVTYRILPASAEAPRVLVWAPKSLFKHAVDRNRMRRLMREAYRLEKQPLIACCTEQGLSLQLAFNYIDSKLRSQAELRHAMHKAIRRLVQQLQEESIHPTE